MDEIQLLNHLEELALRLSLTLRFEPIESEESSFPGGLCRIRNKELVIINSRAPRKEQVLALARALIRFDLTTIYLRPEVRDFLERMHEQI